MNARFPALAMAFVFAACGPYATSADRSEPSPSQPVQAPPSDGSEPSDGSGPPSAASSPEAPPGSTEPAAPGAQLEIVLTGRPIQAFAIGDAHVLTLETDVQTRLVATDKAPPHAVNVLLEEDVLDGVRLEGVGASRGRVFVVDSYGAMRSLLGDGTDLTPEYVPGAPTRILSAPHTLWLADLPRFLGDVLTFHWYGAPPAQVPTGSAALEPAAAVGDLDVDDDALVYATRGGATTLREWAPAATGPRAGDRLLATLPEEGRGVGIDATRAFVHLVSAKEIRAIHRATGASTLVLGATSFDTPPLLRSDGASLYMLTETALRRCTIGACASTMTVLASGLQYARALVIDPSYAWIVMTTKGKTGTIARVPK